MFVRYYVEVPLPAVRVEAALGVVGQTLDRVLLHRVAEATVKDFLDRLGAAMALSPPGGAARMRP